MTISLTKLNRRTRTAPSSPRGAIASARGLVKTYGTGETAVHAESGTNFDGLSASRLGERQ